jgi:hypothetical protein
VPPSSELHFLYETASNAVGCVVGRDATWQIAPVMTQLPYSEGAIADLEAFAAAIAQELPRLGRHGSERAKKAFLRTADTITKPSYLSRIVSGHVWGTADGQFDRLIERFVREPLSGGLVFSVFHPQDLVNRQRPGYVPCLVSGTFLVHDHHVHVNAFFRSQSILEFGVHDLLFLRQLQSAFVSATQHFARDAFPARLRHSLTFRPGPLNLHFARIVIASRLARNRQGFLRRRDVIDHWLRLLVDTIESRIEVNARLCMSAARANR